MGTISTAWEEEAQEAPRPAAGFELAALLTVFRRFWRRIALCGAAGLGLGLVYLLALAVPVYTATSLVMLQARPEHLLDIAAVASGGPADAAAINSEVEVLRSRALLGRVVDRLALVQDPEFNAALRPPGLRARLRALLPAPPAPPEALAAEIAREKVIVALGRATEARNTVQTFVFRISARSRDPLKARAIADALAAQYLDDQVAAKFAATEQATALLARRVAELQLQVERDEKAVADFTAATDLVSADALKALQRQLKELRERIARTLSEQSLAEARLAMLAAASGPAEQVRAAQDAELTRLAEALPPAAPLPAVTAPVALRRLPVAAPGEAARAFATRLAALRAGLEDERRLRAAQVATLERARATIADQIEGQSRELIQLQQLGREAQASRLLYEYVLNRFKETTAQQGIERPDSRALSGAALPVLPSGPGRAMVLGLAGLAGLVLGGGLALGAELRHTRFRDGASAEALTGYPVLGLLPPLPPGRNGAPLPRPQALAQLARAPDGPAGTALRGLRTALQLADPAGAPKVLLTTAPGPGAGRSLLAMGLAQAFASLELSVLLIEGDIGGQAFADCLAAPAGAGLLSVLSGEVALGAAVVADPLLGADVLHAQHSRLCSADIFASPHFAALVSAARAAYDLVIIDAPPLLRAPDARVLAPLADAVLMVLRLEATERADALAALRLLESVHRPATGLALTAPPPAPATLPRRALRRAQPA